MSTYIPTDYVNGGEPAINETNLNHSELGIQDAHEEIEEIALGNTSVASAETCDKSRFVAPADVDTLGGVKVYTVTDTISGEVTGFMDAASITDLPNAVLTFNASDNLAGIISFTFDESSNTLWYDLYREGELIASNITSGFNYQTSAGTWDFYVISNNVFGSTIGVSDEGSAYAIPTEPPAAIEDFTASDDQVQSISFDWTDHHDSFRFDIYSGTTLIQENVRPGVSLILPEGAASYYVRATNHLGFTDSTEDGGTSMDLIPSAITDLSIIEGVAMLTFNFSYINEPATYDLYRDGILIRNNVYSGYVLNTPGGTWNFMVRAVNQWGTSDSNTVQATATAALFPPEQITDFNPVDGRREIIMNFSPALDAESYDLYQAGILTAVDVYPGYVFDSPIGSWNFFIKAINTVGSTDSNTETAESLPLFTAAPVAVTDLTMSTTIETTLVATFTEVPEATRYDLYKNGSMFHQDVKHGEAIPSFPGTWNFRLSAVNPIGSTMSTTDVSGSALPANSKPSMPSNFNATDEVDNTPNLITMTYGISVGAARYDLYRNNVKHQENISPAEYAMQTRAGEWTFFVRAINLLGSTDSENDEGSCIPTQLPPAIITDFNASDDEYGQITMTWSDALDSTSYDIYEESTKVAEDVLSPYKHITGAAHTALYYVIAANRIGDTPCDPGNQGTAFDHLNVPGEIDDFVASDSEIDFVRVTFELAADATSYDLYRNAALVQENIVSGYEYPITGPSTGTYFVRAKNDEHFMDSNQDTGASVAHAPGAVNVYWNTANGNTEWVTLTSDGHWNFEVPPRVEHLNITLYGGGGAGGGGEGGETWGSSDGNGGSGGQPGAKSSHGIADFPAVVPLIMAAISAGGYGGSASEDDGGKGDDGNVTYWNTSQYSAGGGIGGAGGTGHLAVSGPVITSNGANGGDSDIGTGGTGGGENAVGNPGGHSAGGGGGGGGNHESTGDGDNGGDGGSGGTGSITITW